MSLKILLFFPSSLRPSQRDMAPSHRKLQLDYLPPPRKVSWRKTFKKDVHQRLRKLAGVRDAMPSRRPRSLAVSVRNSRPMTPSQRIDSLPSFTKVLLESDIPELLECRGSNKNGCSAVERWSLLEAR
ncbi:hypothetical protein CONPUDRAFT_155415 [Coniophora puteana RWD-64-598 SS2]|uniref:Uncharacterized protein n=1 Tax=Coniophora puteana (strain RWD-64-598) TaxID=741705 RepID=A0A5M3MN52_CONPW|nr:uncharacterized protein CONPUDRAFT_155415 [Coniophora puteana RWD-64-598 SS2]EIW80041.1 hypothetical protein CONPUDRAFT_155415 [Coniophora puteana RWD-64-598 SS2]